MLSYLIKKSRKLLLAAACASVLSAISSVLLLAQITHALTASDPQRMKLALTFGAIAIVSMASHMVASVLFERLSQRAHADLRHFISERVMQTDFRRLEEIGGPKILSALSEHSAKVAEFFVSFPAILINSVVVAGCLLYMAVLSWQVFVAAVFVIGLGSLGYHLAHLRAIRHLDDASKEQDRLFGHFRSLIEGAKELRLNRAKRTVFAQDVLQHSVNAVRQKRTLGMSIFAISASWGSFLIYAFIGLVLFVLVGDIPERARVMTGFSLMFVYIITPLESLLVNLPRANLAKISAARIQEITRSMPSSEAAGACDENSGNGNNVDNVNNRGNGDMEACPNEESIIAKRVSESGLSAPLGHIRLHGVTHSYYHEVIDDIFTLGPINLTFRPGEISFLVGGNGSGKTTLAKLLAGLYFQEHGDITFNAERINHVNRDDYRQNFSAIFSDFHLFDSLLDTSTTGQDVKGNELLKKLHLQHKVQMQDGAFSTRALSQGQRKRLALVAVYLENRPFLIFDEWAADQDPVFKDVFYRELLPELRALGKTILVISHDDRYFGLADRLIRMENGKIIAVENKNSIEKTPLRSADNNAVFL